MNIPRDPGCVPLTVDIEVAKEYEKGESFAAVQIELSSALRNLTGNLRSVVFPDIANQIIGAISGYEFIKRAVGRVALL